MRTLLLLLTLHAACDRPAAEDESEPTSGETVAQTERTSSGGGTDEANETPAPEPERIPPPALEGWATIVGTYVTEDGGFRYEGLRASEAHLAALEETVRAIGEAQDQGWEKPEALAFYVNAYNALTVAAVLEHWPIESVMRVEGFFDTLTHRVAGDELTLNALENDILRSERFADPRIHFVVNCASKSCPPLAREPYSAGNVDAAMGAAARAYVRATTELSSRKVKLSRLFEWFAEDFGGAEGVRAFVASQLEGDAAEHVRSERTELGYDDYDWALNARAEPSTEAPEGESE
jgi:hypothetical protein